jgi:hypothetical protein
MTNTSFDLMADYLAKRKDRLESENAENLKEIEVIDKLLEHMFHQAVPPSTPDVTQLDLEKITWVDTDGPRGPYQRANNQETLHFSLLLKALAKHGGRMEQNGYFVWRFNTDEPIVGRKKR